MPINRLQSIDIYDADFIWRDSHNRSILIVEVEDILMPVAQHILAGAP